MPYLLFSESLSNYQNSQIIAFHLAYSRFFCKQKTRKRQYLPALLSSRYEKSD